MQAPTWLKPGIWGGVVGAVVITIVGFSAGWVVTSGSAQEMADAQSRDAVVASLTPVCVAQFRSEPQQQRTTYLAALEEESRFNRGDYVEDQGWATLPGSEEPNSELADACAEELMKLAEQ